MERLEQQPLPSRSIPVLLSGPPMETQGKEISSCAPLNEAKGVIIGQAGLGNFAILIAGEDISHAKPREAAAELQYHQQQEPMRTNTVWLLRKERLSQSKSATGQVRDAATSILLLRYPVVPQDKVSPDSKHGKTGTDHLLESPHPRMLLGLVMTISLIDLPSATCQEAAGQSSSN
ncbi:hypothetical protein HGM15179_003970 [Zosterops borbonicus]|uniref:Uncharacterized protein n=1 Tax=Zosterops borbonicus TaxID=364589 RepID=A0A8K1LRC4_9PASS|nr:hypothetical protein HGM15179_003970 [Zosterops borbonicus]